MSRAPGIWSAIHRAPLPPHAQDVVLALGDGRRPRVVRPASADRERAVQDQTLHTAGVRRREQRAHGAGFGMPNSTARRLPAASITARTSSMRCSSDGSRSTGTRSDRPVPPLSKWITRQNDPSRCSASAMPGCSHSSSTFVTQPCTNTRSRGPDPKVSYAMLQPPLSAYRMSRIVVHPGSVAGRRSVRPGRRAAPRDERPSVPASRRRGTTSGTGRRSRLPGRPRGA